MLHSVQLASRVVANMRQGKRQNLLNVCTAFNVNLSSQSFVLKIICLTFQIC